MFSLQNKIAVVTGGGSGIGRAISALFAKQGATVHILELTEESAKDAVDEIKANGGKVFSHSCNVANQQEVVATFKKIGNINILVNNAGIAHIGKVDTTPEADFDRIMNVNVKGVYNCLHAAIPQFRKSNGGVIVNMASIAAWVGIPDRFAYSTAKGAVMAMTLSVAKDYLNENIRCNSISPARVHTPFVDGFISKTYPGKEADIFEKLSQSQPIGRMGKPDEVAALALFLCSDEASFITGSDYPIDGGFIKLNN
ncbi:MAG: SDR family oxidoreductase [Flavobacterium sp.]|jgi:NAD(P)-dependent dehydrogenase (short-subunit alcohol dehydrogenase family)|uniref:SDR family NAD(P)-dependent oxidoreductase n=1 Tax=Flavobacterium sp. TaxID=239 RepID=UPI001B5F1813|nr:SDR family oxidoreductase [Flavobacterium sp.]MBP6145982.1 SDR family oxidoreductase [Flavobacterium sp.]MBP7182345.1 SDR family oxidoreductase [Flavobacterium sp.]MBP7316928.1 SDR family oxidoreductase [Flavobacterium sp.]MBP8886716.1 SDR family oxidoreductase [Flavobacterium sp.]HRL70533.1 SDR family oxidoreductase [Flavobacterium sp.]